MNNQNRDDKYDESTLIAMIKEGGRAFEQASEALFQSYLGYLPKVQNKLGLSEEDLHNAYADALVKLIRQLKTASFKGESKLSTYFYRIFMNTAVDVSRHNASNKVLTTQELTPYDAKEKDLLDMIAVKEETRQVLDQINAIGEPCKSILLDWGYFGYSMNEIAKRCQLASAESARSMKYKCLKKLKELISQQTP